MSDRSVRLDEFARFLVMEGLAGAAHLLMRFGQEPDRLPAAVAARDTPRCPALRPLDVHLPDTKEVRVFDGRPVGQGGEGLDTQVNARFLAGQGQRLARPLSQEKQAYHPSTSRLMVTVLGVPSRGRLQRTARRPILESTRKPLSSVAPLPNCL
jgi:hypothetical protein